MSYIVASLPPLKCFVRREIPQGAGRATAITDERSPTAVTAVREPGAPDILRDSIGSNGSPSTVANQQVRTPKRTHVNQRSTMSTNSSKQ